MCFCVVPGCHCYLGEGEVGLVLATGGFGAECLRCTSHAAAVTPSVLKALIMEGDASHKWSLKVSKREASPVTLSRVQETYR